MNITQITIYVIGALCVLSFVIGCTEFAKRRSGMQQGLVLLGLALFILFHAIRRSTGLM